MTSHWHGKPGRRAQLLVDRMKAGSVDTSGNLASWCENVAELPISLRQWIWEDLDRNLEPDAVEYLKSLVREIPDPARITFRQVHR